MTHNPSYSLLSTRLRYNIEGVNAQAFGWIANENDQNVAVEWGREFRIRARVKESAGFGSSTTFHWQVSHNGGTFVDIRIQNNNQATPVMGTFTRGTYANNAVINTQFLTSGGGTFVNGQADANEMSLASSITNQETEFETCFMIMNFFGTGTPQQVGGSDTFRFRLVEGNQRNVFTGPTQNEVTITVTRTNYYIGGTMPEAPVRMGPFIDGNGNIYTSIEPYGESAGPLIMIKSTDGGKSWVEVNGANRPANGDMEAIDMVQDGTELHMVHKESGGDFWYHSFRTSDHSTNPDTWNVRDSNIDLGTSTNYSMAIALRTNGQIIAVYRRTNTNQRIYYRIRTSGVWGSEVPIDEETGKNFTGCRIVRGASDLMHIFYTNYTDGIVYYRNLNSSDVLSGRTAIYSNTALADQEATTPAVYWDDGGTSKVMILIRDRTDNFLRSITVTGTTPGSSKQVSSETVLADPGNTGSSQPTADLVVDTNTKTLHTIYSRLATSTMATVENTNDGTWGTVLQVANRRAHWIRGNVITHSGANGGARVYAYLVDRESDGNTGFIWFEEKVLQTRRPVFVTVT